jgi:1,2-dihydroxy-3-keto-5-methylthiopentene dioxygenase
MKVYFHDNLDTDQRLPHEGEPATLDDLQALGVYASNITDQAEVDRIAEARGYKNRDEVRSLFLSAGHCFARISWCQC